MAIDSLYKGVREDRSAIMTATGTIAANVRLVNIDSTGGTMTVTLPHPSLWPDQHISCKIIAGTNAVTFAFPAGHDVINIPYTADSTFTTLEDADGDRVLFYSDGEAIFVVSLHKKD